MNGFYNHPIVVRRMTNTDAVVVMFVEKPGSIGDSKQVVCYVFDYAQLGAYSTTEYTATMQQSTPVKDGRFYQELVQEREAGLYTKVVTKRNASMYENFKYNLRAKREWIKRSRID